MGRGKGYCGTVGTLLRTCLVRIDPLKESRGTSVRSILLPATAGKRSTKDLSLILFGSALLDLLGERRQDLRIDEYAEGIRLAMGRKEQG